ncbi:MAG TPA: CDP-archaeol synthase [Bdellovibrionales bacterium]|nr:CDP-archaeol synthase [Bdellovibrionales bacterium]
MTQVLEAFWFLVAPGAANLVPPIAAKLWPRWNQPVDGGRELFGKRLFGAHKTIRGFVTGTVSAAAAFQVQLALESEVEALRRLSLLDPEWRVWWFGALLGLSALVGDLLKSFFKRQLGRAPGRPWIPFDQIDWILGALAFLSLFQSVKAEFGVVAILMGLALSLLFKVLGYFLKVNSEYI